MRVTQFQRPGLLRANMTLTERRVWHRVRAKQLGVKFRRQHPIGPYIADFACIQARLVVEIDGDTHEKAYDMHRDAWLGTLGWRVMRISLQEVDEELDSVIEAIRTELGNPGSRLKYHQRSGDIPDHPTEVLPITPPSLPNKVGEEPPSRPNVGAP